MQVSLSKVASKFINMLPSHIFMTKPSLYLYVVRDGLTILQDVAFSYFYDKSQLNVRHFNIFRLLPGRGRSYLSWILSVSLMCLWTWPPRTGRGGTRSSSWRPRLRREKVRRQLCLHRSSTVASTVGWAEVIPTHCNYYFCLGLWRFQDCLWRRHPGHFPRGQDSKTSGWVDMVEDTSIYVLSLEQSYWYRIFRGRRRSCYNQ